ncbi:ATP-binding protein [Cronobacter sakazakii]|uniref:ATP-binding protein n=1 Tax=Cronobacter sakazakii TaxID=28141 RepID=UPI002937664F|nr:ATP-binding protein [Cronobacter sakazakii]EKS1073457.1 ATP-binding protein [Cronobacter sakazakii]EKS1087135.1 ATP-binding protein [Cronobacter sakazakii]ELQ5973811.1 ATP-binding protein [Cronobacter sakazakii]ELQ6034831.1 ATP-binding protein [Cronobacter sakazakii]ELQ6043546.1 ATP-binding protein [Cronobacter sakazakii]
MPNRLIRWTEEVITALTRFAVSRDLPDYCDLRTVVRLSEDDRVRHPELSAPYIMVTDNAYLTVYEIAGSYRESDETLPADHVDSWQGRVDRMTEALTAHFRHHGHKISTVYECDPEGGEAEVKRLLAPQYRSLRRTGLKLNYLLDEQVEKLAPWVNRERTWLVCYTGFAALAGHELRDENARLSDLVKASPSAVFGQNPLLTELPGLKIRHDAFLSQVERAFSDSGKGVLLRRIDAHEAGRVLRQQTDPKGTGEFWQPHLPDDRVIPHGCPQGKDTSSLLAPWLNFQIMGAGVQQIRNNLIEINGTWHGTLAVNLAPQNPQTFARLRELIPRSIPFRIRKDLMPGGMGRLSGKQGILSFTEWVPGLKPIYESVSLLAARERKEPVCVMTITAATWGDSPEMVTRNLTLLKQALDSWGVCGVTHTFGDPVRAWVSTLTASSVGSGPCLLYPPLSEALNLMPLTRPASAWNEDGNALYPTPDGKIMPVGLATPKQTKLTTIVAGESGGGKSVLINRKTIILASSAQQQLPFVAEIDKGFSAVGSISMLRAALPPERQDEVLSIILQNAPEFCRNLFDIQLGLTMPLSYESEFMENMLTALCIDPATGEPPNGRDTPVILRRLVVEAFKMAREDPRRYEPGLVPEVDEAIQKADIWNKHPELRDHCTWYEIRDLLQDAGNTDAAQRAQFRAVPELADMAPLLGSQDFQINFGKICRDGSTEALIEYLARCLRDACGQYRMFAGRTRFMISPKARVITVDLQYVAGGKSKSGHLQTGIMYMFAGHIAGGDFVLPQYQDELFSGLHRRWHELHAARVEQLDQEVKTRQYDEVHNAKDAPFIFPMLETADREQRKFGVRTVFSTQYFRDLPDTLRQSANSVYMVAVDPEDRKLLQERFRVPDVTLDRFARMGSGPSDDGSGVPFLGIFRVKGGSTIAHIMKNAVGPQELWGHNTTPEDMSLRRMLEKEVGAETARRILGRFFPGGSAAKVIEHRRRTANEANGENAIRSLARELINKMGYDL